MPVALDPQPYLDAARCAFSCIPPGLIWYANLAVLIDIINGDPVPTDTNELLNEARCLQSCIPAGLLPYATLQALTDVATIIAAGGTGGCCNLDGVVDPVAAPTDPAITWLYTNTAATPTQTLWVWPAGGPAWIQLI